MKKMTSQIIGQENKLVKKENVSIVNIDFENIEIAELLENEKQVQAIQATIAIYEKEANSIIVNDEVSQLKASEKINELKRIEKIMTEKTTDYKEPFQERVNTANKKINPLINSFKNVRDKFTKLISQYLRQQEEIKRKQDEANRKKIEAAAEKGRQMPVIKTVQVQNKIETSNGTKLTFQDVWKIQSVDNLNLFLTWCIENNRLDEVIKIQDLRESGKNSIAKQYKDSIKIPGVTIVCEKKPISYL